MIGIIGAMEIEIEHIKEKMLDISYEKISGMDFYTGKINEKKIVLAKSFEGKVNSSMCAQTMILKYNPECILNAGVAGAISSNLKIFDIVISKNAVEFDFDTIALGYELGYAFGVERVYIECSQNINNILKEIADKENTVYIGNVASSDKFVTENVDKGLLKREFDNILSVDMESASIAHVCFMNNVPFSSLRAISDTGNDTEFREFIEIAVEKLDKIIIEFINRI